MLRILVWLSSFLGLACAQFSDGSDLPYPEHLKRIPELSQKDLIELIQTNEKKRDQLNQRDELLPGWNDYLTEKEEIEKAMNKAISRYNAGPKTTTDETKKRLEEIDRVLSDLKQLGRERFRRISSDGMRRILERQRILASQMAPSVPQLLAQPWNPADFPRIGGSTSTQPLAKTIACRAFQLDWKWVGQYQGISWRSPRGMQNPMELLIQELTSFQGYDSDIQLMEYALQAESPNKLDTRLADFVNVALVKNESTHLAYLNIVDGKTDLAIIARPPIPDEIEYATQKEVPLEVVPCAKDALIFLVHGSNDIGSLTVEQVRQMYSGKVTGWSQVGGKQGMIKAYRRPEDSGSEPWMKSLVMQGEAMSPKVSNDLIGQLMSDIFLKVSEEPFGIAYSLWYYEQYMLGTSETRTLRINDVEPTFESIRDGTYPLVGDVVIVMRANTLANSPTRRLRDWLLTPEGQSVVVQSGYALVRP
jgi:ABC-type phosphate transport system substrate-binding protein